MIYTKIAYYRWKNTYYNVDYTRILWILYSLLPLFSNKVSTELLYVTLWFVSELYKIIIWRSEKINFSLKTHRHQENDIKKLIMSYLIWFENYILLAWKKYHYVRIIYYWGVKQMTFFIQLFIIVCVVFIQNRATWISQLT